MCADRLWPIFAEIGKTACPPIVEESYALSDKKESRVTPKRACYRRRQVVKRRPTRVVEPQSLFFGRGSAADPGIEAFSPPERSVIIPYMSQPEHTQGPRRVIM